MNKKYSMLVFFVLLTSCVAASNLKKLDDNDLYNFKLKSALTKQKYKREILNRHPEWDENVRRNVLMSTVEVGMTEPQVLASIGKPAEILGRESSEESESHALWVYRSRQLQFDSGKLSVVYDKKP